MSEVVVNSGPCESWITAAEVAECCGVDVGTDTALFDDVAVEASMLLFEFSGKQFPGVCEQTVRPCASGCMCWAEVIAPANMPALPWSWGIWGGAGWGWGYAGCGDACGCGSLSRAILPGYPVMEILEVKIDGTVLDPTEYRLDEYRWLTRMADAAGNVQFWPACQRLDLPDTEAGTWSATYRFGQEVPLPGQRAAKQLACELYRSCMQGEAGECSLPVGVTRLTRQGVEIQRTPFINWAFQNGAWMTGIGTVDAFLQAYNPWGLRRRASVWSPDIVPYGRLVGSGS